MADKIILSDRNQVYLHGRPRYFPELSPDEQRSFLEIRGEHLGELEEDLYPDRDYYNNKRPTVLRLYQRILFPFAFRFTFLYIGIVLYAFFPGSDASGNPLRKITVYAVLVITLEVLAQLLTVYSRNLQKKSMRLRIKEHRKLRERYLQ